MLTKNENNGRLNLSLPITGKYSRLWILGFCLYLLVAGCASGTKVPYSQLQFSKQSNPFRHENLGNDYLKTLLEKMRGRQFGDHIFKGSSKAYWIIPEIDKLELEIIAAEAQLSEDEYQNRIARFEELHENYLVFALDLRVPLYSKWTQKQLDDFIRTNLVITLENGTGSIFLPERVHFQVIERFQDESLKNVNVENRQELEVSIPLRALFKKRSKLGSIIAGSTQKVLLKVRLRKNPPYKIGFFDDKFYQGFLWKIVSD